MRLRGRVRGLPATVSLRHGYLPADGLKALRWLPLLSLLLTRKLMLQCTCRERSALTTLAWRGRKSLHQVSTFGGVRPICQSGELLSRETGRVSLAFDFS